MDVMIDEASCKYRSLPIAADVYIASQNEGAR